MRRVHFIGIGGTAMATLAVMLRRRGDQVQGSDGAIYPPMSDQLAAEGIVPFEGYRAEQVGDDVDLVVVGNAISRGNIELEAVLDRKLRYASLPEVVRDEFLWQTRSLVVAGTHGKTTTAAIVAWLLTRAGRDPSVLLGGVAQNLGAGYRLGQGAEFVIEGDEYDSAYFDKTAKFLKYLPDVAIVGNIEFDHADIYEDLDAIRLAFRRLVRLIPDRGLLLLGADRVEASALALEARCRVESFGLSTGADWRAVDVAASARGTTFGISRGGEPFAEVASPLLGGYNVRNVLAAVAMAADVGLEPASIAEGVASFEGVRRRLEPRGEVRGVTVYDDFAHHPTAVAETLAGVRAAYPGRRVWAIFEPRSATACRRVMEADLTAALQGADEVVLPAVFRASVPEAERLSAERVVAALSAQGVHARFLPTVDEIVRVVASEAGEGDRIVVMSNGAFENIHVKLLAALGDA
ncbi:MAG: UDP-N-acetylmuramate:L-alanyl-gamma-D-glutamyl-meso-diaminopimelate ligase [Vicinamibacterales bacterium]|nr:UDP-N-acetylmuramate:L-alanyl-gamma-D-glutamyl-meso-diaminopimelate ligase [Vicinamibacterales bacterium]